MESFTRASPPFCVSLTSLLQQSANEKKSLCNEKATGKLAYFVEKLTGDFSE
jgi:hypothetical protein